MAQSELPCLPPEMWDLISSFCNRDTLFNLRLVSRTCRAATEPYMFTRLNAYNSGRASAGMAKIAADPTFSSNCSELCLRARKHYSSRERSGFYNNVRKTVQSCPNIDTVTLVIEEPPEYTLDPEPEQNTDLLGQLLHCLGTMAIDGFSPRHFRAAFTNYSMSGQDKSYFPRISDSCRVFFSNLETFSWVHMSVNIHELFYDLCQYTPSLRTLSLTHAYRPRNQFRPGTWVFWVLRRAKWDHLTHLSVAGISVAPRHTNFILRHSATLRTLALRQLDLEFESTWNTFFRCLRGRMRVLNKVILAGKFIGDTAVHVQVLDFGPSGVGAVSTSEGEEDRKVNNGEIFDVDDDTHVNNELGAAVEQYILHGGPGSGVRLPF